jgi:hypothetical protein
MYVDRDNTSDTENVAVSIFFWKGDEDKIHSSMECGVKA